MFYHASPASCPPRFPFWKTFSLFCLLAVIAGLTPAHAQSQGSAFQGLSLGARLGTLGPGLELTKSVTPRFNVRVGGNFFTYQDERILTNLEVETRSNADVKLQSASAVVDFFPVRRGFRLTTGLIFNGNRADIMITPTEPYTIDDKTFQLERIGTMNMQVGHKSKVNPYLGFGFGNTVRPEARLGLTFDMGVLYTNSPDVEMSGTGMIAASAENAPVIEENLEGIKLYPQLSIGLSYRLF